MAIDKGSDDPYRSTLLGTRAGYWAFFGIMMVFWIFYTTMVFLGYYASDQTCLLDGGVVMIIMIPVWFGIAIYRARAFKGRKKEGV